MFFDCIIMLRRINKQSCRNSLDAIPESVEQARNFPFPLNRLTSAHHQGKHKKYFSTSCSMGQSPLCVRKEALRVKGKEKVVPVVKEMRLKRKQKTQHFNYKYLEWMRLRQQGMSWIQYNMTLGIAYLWKKVQAQIEYFQQARNIKYNCKFEQQVDSINQQIDSIIQEVNVKTPAAQKEDFGKLFRGRDSVQFNSLSKNLAKVEKKLNSSNFQKYYQAKQNKKNIKNKDSQSGLGSTAIATPNKEISLNNLKESVCKLNSYFCLFKRRITLRKQDQLINQFMQRRSSNVSFTANEIQELEQIMRINQQRCELMSEIINNVGILRSHESSLLMSQKLLKRIGEIDLIKELNATAEHNREDMLKAKMKSFNDIIAQIAQPEHLNDNPAIPSQIVQDSDIFGNTYSNCDIPKPKKHIFFHRSSIESFVSPPNKENYNHVSSKVNLNWKERTHQRSQNHVREQREKEKAKKAEKDKENILIKKNSLKKPGKVDEGQRKKTQRKAIAFACIQEDAKALTDNKSVRSKMKSARTIKSKKQLTWDDLEGNKEYRSLKSVKSLKSLKSLKSIGSYSELGSRKYLRSLKTQREMKYLHGHIRDIAYISKYRNKLFKLNGVEDENTHVFKDFQDATTENKISQRSSNISINQVGDRQHDKRSRESIEDDLQINPVQLDEPKVSVTIRSLQKLSKDSQRSNQANDFYADWALQKESIFRQFFSKFGLIQKEKNISKQKCLILNELQKMLDNKIIDQQLYERYRALFEGDRRSTTNSRQSEKAEAESDKKMRPSPYTNLLNFRKLISDTTQLNQINKYYYNISQFKCEEEQIKMTKQANKRDDFFFNIRSTTEYQQKRIRDSQHHQEERRQWIPHVLYQKEI